MVINREELAWAAGIFEGEGSITKAHRYHPNSWAIRLSVGNTDLQMLRVFHAVLSGLGYVNGPLTAGRQKPLWTWQTNKFEHVQAVMAMFWYWLSPRRRTTYSVLAKDYHNRNVDPKFWTKKSKKTVDQTTTPVVESEGVETSHASMP